MEQMPHLSARRPSTMKLTPEQEDFYRLIRTKASWDQPWLATALFSLIPVNAPDVKTMGVDMHWRVYINFDAYMNRFEGEEDAHNRRIIYGANDMNHEPWHLLRAHGERFMALDAVDQDGILRNHDIWNYAGDLTINQAIPKLINPDRLFPENQDVPPGLLTEEYYDILMKRAKENQKCKSCNGEGEVEDKPDEDQDGENGQDQDGQDPADSGQDGDQEGAGSGDGDEDSQDGDGSGNGQDSDQDGDDSDGDGSDQDSQDGKDNDHKQGGKPGNGNGHAPGGKKVCPDCNGSGIDAKPQGGVGDMECGSGSGNPQKWEIPGNEGDSVDGSRSEDLARETAINIQQFANSRPGTVPAELLLWAEDMLKPHPIDWRKVLRAQVKKGISSWQKGKADYTYRRPSRRQQSREIIQPSMHSPRPRVAVAVDSSGSNIHNLALIAAQVNDLMKQANVRGKSLLVFAVDASAKDVRPVSNLNQIKETIMKGGGGTDMRVAYQTIADLHKEGKVDMGVVITDLETPWPAENPGRMPFITIGVVGETSYSESAAKVAQETIGEWSQLVLIPEADINSQ